MAKLVVIYLVNTSFSRSLNKLPRSLNVMDDLQDAIEDAQYVNAVVCADSGPRPVVRWSVPTEGQLDEWRHEKNKQLKQKLEELLTTDAHQKSNTNISDEPRNDMPEDQPQQQSSNSSSRETLVLLDMGDPLQSYEYICSEPLGFFLFAQYVKDVREDYIRMNFVEEVILYKKIHGNFLRAEKAIEIAKDYLIYKRPISSSVEFSTFLTTAASKSATSTAKQRPSAVSTHGIVYNADKELVILGPSREGRLKPSKKHITELDLCRSIRTSLDKCSLSPEELLQLLVENKDSANTASPIGISDGPVLRKALCRCGFPVADDDDKEQNATTTDQLETPTIELEESKHAKDTDETKQQVEENDDGSNMGDLDVFDFIELIVMESLKQDYWKDFLASKEYKRLLHFWWNRDQTVVEEDFYLMRALGRGGFGLVHGMLVRSRSACRNDCIQFFFLGVS